ncbi:DUF3152 domain-containing protein [Bifidobacterium eulemuris]|uniref:DUF3152 domain-containing protein n=1 Tax=Bifidobacterium eulemuris TaxID=1765219 RepID=A0A261GER3_9BIFI|nr:DUF3152 domain-containing protein [Bifidobacterium eulemuris]OZG69555.1 hypothetical protein BEUL_0147 [Bifidobacterium eulemuris]QOL32100.1 DUF3152 domain-containing protein [Bifidobacterium eulemuris]
MIRRIVVFGTLGVLLVAALAVILTIWHSGKAADDAAGGDAATRSSQTSSTSPTQGGEASDDGDGGADGADNSNDAENTDENAQSSENASDDGTGESAPLSADQRAELLAQAEQTANASGQATTRYRYCVATNGEVGDAAVFSDTVFSTLNSPEGWPRAGVTFEESADGQCDMTLILSEAQYMSSYSEGCSESYSCRVGDSVIINVDRWNSATEDWLANGGTLARYRRMVINHEVGHRLGHTDNETTCGGAGQAAPLMQQQSMDLRGCSPNEWPLDSELWVAQ